MNRLCVRAFLLVIILISSNYLAAQDKKPAKKPLDHASYDVWNSLTSFQLSDNGQWLWYALTSGKGDKTLTIRSIKTDKMYIIPRVSLVKFSHDSAWAVYLLPPTPEEVKKAKDAKKKPEEFPKNSLEILSLGDGKKVTIPAVASYVMPSKGSGWLAYLLEAKAAPPGTKTPAKPAGKELILRNLKTGAESNYYDVTAYLFSDDGSKLAFLTIPPAPAEPGAYLVDTAGGKLQDLARGKGKYQSLTFADDGSRLAFLTTRDDAAAKTPAWSVYLWKAGDKNAQAIVTDKSAGIPKGWTIASTRNPSFSPNGKRLFFGTAPKPQPNTTKDDVAKVKVDIWHWKDSQLQPVQLAQLKSSKDRNYLALIHLDTGKILPLATPEIPSVTVDQRGDDKLLVANTDVPYEHFSSWDYPAYHDVYLIDMTTGTRQKVLTRLQATAALSPEGKYLTWWDGHKRAWFARSTASGKIIALTSQFPHPLHNELHDIPSIPPAYGAAGWLKGDKAFLIYDKFDLWAIDPENVFSPTCITDEFGRQNQLIFRHKKLDTKSPAIDPDQPLLLTATHDKTKASGFYEDQVRGTTPPKKLALMNELLTFREKADNGDAVIVTRSTFQKYPDLWLTDLRFQTWKQLTTANPQQKDYLWGSAELVEWLSLDGTPLQGILYKPENFDPKKKYPMIVYFYERLSDGLHKYITPSPTRASINISFYVSRGYVVFLPDIPYEVGHPGQSCLKSVVPGVTALIQRGFIDADHIGIQGHSWGGYQVAYLITKCNLFAAAEAGAPVSNMTSAYGGIRWTTGKSRMFQYEKSQSRIGGTPWNMQQRYLENSPLFWADRVQTPLLMLHNDRDGAVPWYQGIEMFVALRRLGKPCWMVNYNGEDHGLTKKENMRDWSIRMQQFFDHYLQQTPPPVWLADGLPALRKGETLGLDLVAPNGSK
jgi:dipeptidyl aminopeptidase/acylaminoacyl peptidase